MTKSTVNKIIKQMKNDNNSNGSDRIDDLYLLADILLDEYPEVQVYLENEGFNPQEYVMARL
jgi:hypothetical protein